MTVTLRTPTEADRAAYVALRRGSAAHLKPWEPLLGDDHAQFGDASFDRLLNRVRLDSDEPFLIGAGESPTEVGSEVPVGTIVGYVGLGQIYRGPFCSCFMGYWIGTPFLGKGFGAAGVRAAADRALSPTEHGGLGLHRVEANIIPNNAASLALIKRVGFRLEGYSPRYLKIAGRWQDHERWAITAEDWAEDRAGASIRAPE
ncbi:MAG: ribosomal-protein-alanine N-acetyltransferase [Phycisphaerales bacterium]|jgi:ribosomal-protein-alanine N-acetyltransferase